MSRLFTHHDRLVLFGSDDHDAADDHRDDDNSSSSTPISDGPTHRVAKGSDHKTAAGRGEPHKGGFVLAIPHFHKVAGLIALINILLYVTPLYHSVVATLGWTKLVRLCMVHPVLALSSFEFTVPRQRSAIYTLYKEMQLHAVVFTMRSFAVFMGAYYGVTNVWLRCALVLTWHPLADYVTANYAPPTGETTIRRAIRGEPGYKEFGLAARLGVYFMGAMQLVGTYMMMADTQDTARMAMCVMGPVQISSLLATLVRKGYASSKTNVIMYGLILMPILFAHSWSLFDVAAVAIVTGLRFYFRMNKYVIWGLVTIALAARSREALVMTVVDKYLLPVVAPVLSVSQ